jgi:Radical SAM superfamily
MKVVLISTYELGRQPFGLASPAAWLRAEGHQVTMADLSCSCLPQAAVAQADLIAFFLPMHTATRLFLRLLGKIQSLNPRAHLCCYGLYAPLNDPLLRRAGIRTVIGGEFEPGLVELARRLSSGSSVEQEAPLVSLGRLRFRTPDRAGLPPLGVYAKLMVNGVARRAGYTEASRGCKHLCRHCPVVPVYRGVFRIVQPEVALEDIRQQVAAGAEHITFGDPDFFNGPGHAIPIVEALHTEWPALTYDVTIKIEHLLKHRGLLPTLRKTGCLFVTSAVESLEDAVLEKLDKGHTRADFIEALSLTRAADLPLVPTFIPFTPWTTLESYRELLRAISQLDLIDQVAPIQLAIRLLLPEGSLLLELSEVRSIVQPFDSQALYYPWENADPVVDRLCASIRALIQSEERCNAGRGEIFPKIWELAEAGPFPERVPCIARAPVPYLTEPWYCCAEPVEDQAVSV